MAQAQLFDSALAKALFTPLQIKGILLRNRIVVSPMCQYSSEDGFANDWHLVHLGSRAVGGAALVFTEATAISVEGRISHADLGIWKEEHVDFLSRIADFIKRTGAVPGIQLAHSGRKASTKPPWEGGNLVPESVGGWCPVAPSPEPFHAGDPAPLELSSVEIRRIVSAFSAATERALRAGFEVVEIHGAHGYLIHEFLSPLSNHRADEYGGRFENRVRFALEVAGAIRSAWPENLPLLFRISATDWVNGGWTLDESVELARLLGQKGVDLIDCSSGGINPKSRPGVVSTQQIPTGYQVPFAARIRREAGILTGAVGLITTAEQGGEIIRSGKADLIFMARQLLRDPYFPLHSATALELPIKTPIQYFRAYTT